MSERNNTYVRGDSVERLHVDKITSIIKNSSTEPCDAELNNGQRVIIKLNNNIQGNLSLVNEYICYKIAKQLSLPIPVSGIAIVDTNTNDAKKLITPENIGCCFYSVRINHVTVINKSIISKIDNKNVFLNLLVFDHLIYNKDRNLGNLLVTMKKPISLYLIDHTHVFKNQCMWDKHCFSQGISSNDYLDENIMSANLHVYNIFFEHLMLNKDKLINIAMSYKNIVTSELLERIIVDIPSEWLPNKSDLNELIIYILYRAKHLLDIVNVIMNFGKE